MTGEGKATVDKETVLRVVDNKLPGMPLSLSQKIR
jgi:hypothetical protein